MSCTIPGRIRARVATLAAASLAVTGLVLTAAPAAHADPVTVVDPVSGASITLSSAEITAGERIQIHGEGFLPVQGSTGEPLVAIRPYDFDAGPAWTIGGEDAYDPVAGGNPTAASEARHWFVTDHTDGGSFDGWIQAPATLTKAGPLDNGDHWLRVLSGAFFTTTGDRLTEPITFKAPLTVVDKVSTGLTSPTGVFQQGTVFRPSAQITLRGRGFTPDSAVTVSLDGSPLAGTITTGPDGSIPSSARATLPAGVSLGSHTVQVATGSVGGSVPITVTGHPSATVLTDPVRPGGSLAYDLSGYIGVGGQPQKIAVVVDEQVLACVQADAAGAAGGVVAMPQDISGSVVVGFNVGLSCILPPAGVIDDQPISRIAPTIGVSATARAVAVDGACYAGGEIRLDGSGFTPSAAVTVTVGGEPAGVLTADATGAVAGPVQAPAGAGQYRVLATDGSGTAATSATVQPRRIASIALTAPAAPAYGAARAATVRLRVAGSPAAGTVVLSQGGWSATVAVAAAGTSVSLPATTPAGRHTLTARYAGDGTTSPATASVGYAVGKASATASIKLEKAKVKRSKRAVATLRVAVAGGVVPTGTIAVYDGKKRIGSYALAAGHRGALKVKLPKLKKKKGKHRLKVVYAGNGNISSSVSKIVRLKVR